MSQTLPLLRRYAALSACVIAVVLCRQPLADRAHTAARKDRLVRDVLPSPEALSAMSLGHKSALADVLWAGLIVDFGEAAGMRLSHDPRPRIAAIQELDPGFKPLYEFMDTFLVLGSVRAEKLEFVQSARDFFERGIQQRPYDAHIWLHYGQFMAYAAPGVFVDDVPRVTQWKTEGAHAIQHAVELGADAKHSFGAAGILRFFGQESAALASLERQLAIVDDPDQRAQLEQAVERARGAVSVAQSDALAADYIPALHEHLRRLGWIKGVDRAMAWGPFPSAAKCEGDLGLRAPECATTWADRLARWRAE